MRTEVHVTVLNGKVVVLVGDPSRGDTMIQVPEGQSMSWPEHEAPKTVRVVNEARCPQPREKRVRFGFGNE